VLIRGIVHIGGSGWGAVCRRIGLIVLIIMRVYEPASI